MRSTYVSTTAFADTEIGGKGSHQVSSCVRSYGGQAPEARLSILSILSIPSFCLGFGPTSRKHVSQFSTWKRGSVPELWDAQAGRSMLKTLGK